MTSKNSKESGDIRQAESTILLTDLRQLIAEGRQDVARQVNSAIVILYWRIGRRIRQDILKEKRAEYGEQIVTTKYGGILFIQSSTNTVTEHKVSHWFYQ